MDAGKIGLGIVLALGLAWTLWQKHQDHALTAAIRAMTDEYGFITFAPPNGGRVDEVLVAAAINCPGEAAVHADQLAQDLKDEGVAVRRISSFEFTASPDADPEEFVKVHNRVMSQDAPMVFVNGKVKSKPSMGEVLAEYRLLARP